jgi:hypothetical protein
VATSTPTPHPADQLLAADGVAARRPEAVSPVGGLSAADMATTAPTISRDSADTPVELPAA